MLQYLIILLDDTSPSYCHYENGSIKRRIISIDTLRQGIRFGMMENLMIQYVYPNYELPVEYKKVIESIDHSKIKTYPDISEWKVNDADVLILNNYRQIEKVDVPIVLRINKEELFDSKDEIAELLSKTPRLNIVLNDVETFTDKDFDEYQIFLQNISEVLEKMYAYGKSPQLNLLTDRMMLKKMNNCGAGETNITLAPNGKFYICPAFYYENESNCIGDLENGLNIQNKQLYKIEYAPICRHCDAYQCKRCIWLNRKTTLEVNTPSHEQCVLAHIERKVSKDLLERLHKHSLLSNIEEIGNIDYLDPFEKRNKWQ